MYYTSFKEYYSIEEYIELINKLPSITNEKSIKLINILNKDLIFVERTIDTYDKFEQSIAIIDLDGNVINGWNSNWKGHDIQYRAKCGDYFFIITKAVGNSYYYDVVDKTGKTLSTIHCKSAKYDIGEGYIFFSFGREFGNIMTPSGEVIELNFKSVLPSYGNVTDGSLEDDDSLGRISEGLFYLLSIGNNNTAAYYYNTNGEVVIDLSTRAVNFKVTQLSDFSNGQARIEFTGANGKYYYGFIDKNGDFIEEPKLRD